MKNFTSQQAILTTGGTYVEKGIISRHVKSLTSFMFSLLLLLVFQVNTASAQATSGAALPGTSPNFCPNCTAEDIKVASVDIVPLTNPVPCYKKGDLIGDAKFVFNLDVTARQRYGLVIYFELWQKGGIAPLDKYYVCADKIFSKGLQTFGGNEKDAPIFRINQNLPAVDLEIRNVFTGWDNQNTQTFCSKTTFSNGTIEISQNSPYTLTYGYSGNFLINDCKKIAPKCKSYLSLPLNLPITPYIELADPKPILCEGTTSANLNFSSVSSNANQYSIDYADASIPDVTNAAFPANSPIVLNLPGSLTAKDYNATITVRNSVSGCNSSANFTFTVKPKTTIGSISTTNAGPFCSSDAAPELSVSASGSGSISYQWYKNNSNSNSGGTMIGGATNSSYYPSLATPGTIYYYVIATGECGTAKTNAIGVTVTAPPQITSNCNSSNSYCKNASANAITIGATGTSLTYQWYSNVSNSTSGGSMITGATDSRYTPSTSSEGTMYYYVVVSGSCGSVTSGVATVTIKKLTVINTQPFCSGSYCKNSPASALSVVADGVNLSYHWYSNTTNSTAGASVISGQTTASYTPPTSSAGNKYYYVVVSGDCGTVASDFVEIMVDELTSITSQPSCAGSYCQNDVASALSVTAIGTDLSYQWYINSANSTAGATAITDATTTAYTPSTDMDGDSYYYVVVNGKCNDVASNIVKVTVKKTTSINTQPSCTSSYCKNTSASALNVVAEGSHLSYQWYSNTTNSTVGASAISDETTASYTPPTTSVGSMYYYVVVSGDCGTVTSDFVDIMVDELTSITSQPSCIGSYCQNDVASALSVMAIGTDLSYQWYMNSTNSTVGATAITDATTTAFTPSTEMDGDAYYYVVVGGECNDVVSDIIKVTVKKTTSINTQPSCTSSYCKNSPASALSVVADGSNLSYQWYSNTTNSTVGASAISDETTASYTPPTSSVGSMYYYVVVSGDCGTVTSDFVDIMVDELTSITSQPSCSASSYCQDVEADDLTVTAVGTDLSYQWYMNSSNSTSGATAITDATTTAYTPSTEMAGDMYYYVVVDGECNDVTSDIIKVTINAKPSINEGGQPVGASYCKGSETSALSVDASGYQLSYVWYSYAAERSDAVSVGNSSTLDVSSDVVGTTRYFVVVSGACSPAVTSDCVSVVVNETTEITSQPDGYDVCKGGVSKNLVVVASGSKINYQWYSNSSSSTSGSTEIVGATNASYTPSVNNSGSTYYYVVVSTEYCNSETSDIVKVQVNDCGAFCTYTQGYYGNDNMDGGIAKYDGHCQDGGTRVPSTIGNAIASMGGTIVLGAGSNTVTITSGDVTRIRMFLPAGGTPTTLKGGNMTMQMLLNSGSKNNLLAQTMTLALNIGLNKGKDIENYTLQAKYLKTEKSVDCGSLMGSGSFKTVSFKGITAAMDVDEDGQVTIGEIFKVANKVLGGFTVGNVTPSQIAGIVGAINEGFDECRIARSFEDAPTLSTTSLTTGIAVKAYPNPFISSFNIVFTSSTDGDAKVDFFDESGRNLGVINRNNVIAGVETTIQYKAPMNTPAVIFYRLSIGNNIVTGKVLSHVIR